MVDLISILVELAPIVIRKGKKWLAETPLELAIAATERNFPDVACRPALLAWASSDEFNKLMTDLLAGNAPDPDALVHDFVRLGDFVIDGDESATYGVARALLDTFARQLWNELLLSEQGRVFATGAVISRLDVLSRGVDALVAAGPPDDVSSDVEIRIDTARSLIHAGRTSAARQLLLELRDGQHGDLDSEASSRVSNNLGACALRDGRIDEAEVEFRRALADHPDHPKAAANLALIDVLNGDYDSAISRLDDLGATTGDPHVASIRILALGRRGDWVGLERLLETEPIVLTDDTCLVAQGEVYCRAGRYDDALVPLRTATDVNPENSEAWLLLALATHEEAQRALRDRFAAGLQLPADSLASFEEALGYIERALEILEKQDPGPRLADARAGRAGLLALLGRDEEALQACDAALADDAEHPVALRNKGLLLIDRSLEESKQVLRKAVSVDDSPMIRSALGRVLVETSETDEAIAVLSPLLDQELNPRDAIMVAREMVNALVASDQAERARGVVDWLAEKPYGEGESLLLRARLLTSPNESDERVSLLRRATVVATGATRLRGVIDLADALFERGEFSEAADLYGSLGLGAMDASLARRYVVSLFNARRLTDALESARVVRNGGPAVSVVTEIELLVLEQIDSIEAAYDLARQLVELEPDTTNHRIRAADFAIRLHREDEALTIANEIPEASYWSGAVDCVNVAILRARLRMDGVIRIAYRAHRLAKGDAEVESRFIGLVLGRESDDEESLGDPLEVRVGTSVTIDLQEGERLVTIEDEDPGLLDHEVPSGDALAVAILGHGVGDVVTLKDTPLERIDATIKDIRLSWVAGFQNAIEGFTTRFPDHPALSRVALQDDDLTPIFLAVERRHRLVSQVLEWYRERHIPLGGVAYLSGASEVEVWGGIVGSRETRLFAAGGSHDEQAAHAETLRDSTGLVLEISSLLSLGSLELEGAVKSAFPDLIVAQASLDLLTRATEMNVLGARASMVLGMEEGRFTRQEISDEDLARGRAFFERLRDFVAGSTEVASTPAALGLDAEERERLNAVLGKAGLASALLASERTKPLASDDLFYRGFAEEKWALHGVWTQALLREMVKRNAIERADYEDALVRLAASGYWFISISSDDLVGLLQREMALSPGFGRLLELLRGPDCSLDSAVSMVADLIRALYLEGFMPLQGSLVLDAALAALTHGRDPAVALAALGRALDSRLLLMPLAHDDVRQRVLLWARQLGLNV